MNTRIIYGWEFTFPDGGTLQFDAETEAHAREMYAVWQDLADVRLPDPVGVRQVEPKSEDVPW